MSLVLKKVLIIRKVRTNRVILTREQKNKILLKTTQTFLMTIKTHKVQVMMIPKICLRNAQPTTGVNTLLKTYANIQK